MGLTTTLVKVWDRALHVVARVAYNVPIAKPERHGIRLLRDVPYRDSGRRSHLLDIYRPKGAGLRPAVLYVHGGGFAILSKDTHRVMAMAFARQGYVVFNINYRLGPQHRYPAALEDAAAALLWVKEHARAFGADPSPIVLAGESAGANLVAALWRFFVVGCGRVRERVRVVVVGPWSWLWPGFVLGHR